MTVAQYLIDKLVECGITDVFGIPGSVIMDFAYAAEQNRNIDIHLNYHEQCSAYAACGYAQISGKPGVAYSTKGPGVTNMMTTIVEAYCDSIPVIFITAHSQKKLNNLLRIEVEQEIDHVQLVRDYVKCAFRIDDLDNVVSAINIACREVVEGRPGPVFLDFLSSLFNLEVGANKFWQPKKEINDLYNDFECIDCVDNIIKLINDSARPLFLIGDGIRQSDMANMFNILIRKIKIPVLSSRFSQDILSGAECYFGFIGSHGMRYSNMIISKADCIITLGNRMAFNVNSKSFKPVIEHARIIRIDIDENELNRRIPGAIEYNVDLRTIIPLLNQKAKYINPKENWLNICNIIKTKMEQIDVISSIKVLSDIINRGATADLVCDEGNNEILVSIAYAVSANPQRLLYSKTMKTVGSAIGKAIGAYYAKRNRVICFVGDQGIQFNIQELQYISVNNLPITIVICNNDASGMLKNSQRKKGYTYYLHTTKESGYGHPDFSQIARTYNMIYTQIDCQTEKLGIYDLDQPGIIELIIDDKTEVIPELPLGAPCGKFFPKIDSVLYDYLEML